MELSRVLYIDDDPGISRLVQRHLERAGFRVTLAENGEDGVRLAASNPFDAIGLDHYMPGRDGLEVLETLRKLPAAPPIIFVTGAEEPRIAVTALKSGAADYVVKDVHGGFIELLAASIAQEITRARLQRERDAAEQEVRDSRDRLEKLAAQQAVLLREVNHRVANSLQLIVSLIELQARRVPDEAARAILRQAAERVEAVTLVHRRLYTGADVAFVDMDSYLAGLVEELGRAVHGGHPVRMELQAAPVRLETDRAVALGLVVNELVTNALKYAYEPGAEGVVRVMLDHAGPDTLRLTVEDDGVGYAPEARPRGSGLGSLIVSSMAHSLGATVTRDPRHRGTRCVVTLPGQSAPGDAQAQAA
jgi:two-component sensor histidine kinase/CheY-like chemotaxis protein